MDGCVPASPGPHCDPLPSAMPQICAKCGAVASRESANETVDRPPQSLPSPAAIAADVYQHARDMSARVHTNTSGAEVLARWGPRYSIPWLGGLATWVQRYWLWVAKVLNTCCPRVRRGPYRPGGPLGPGPKGQGPLGKIDYLIPYICSLGIRVLIHWTFCCLIHWTCCCFIHWIFCCLINFLFWPWAQGPGVPSFS